MTTSIQVSGGRTPIEEARLIEPALKRALYECLERIRATKAALYLATSYGTSQVYELVTSYGWTAPPPRLDERYPIVARLLANRLPLMVNSLGADRATGEVRFEQGSERPLALPIFGRGRRLVGIVDLRDKAGQKPFEPADAAAADTVREAIEKELAAKGLYGVGDGSVVETPKRRRGSSAKYSAVMRAEAALLPETLVRPETTASPGAAEVIRAARGRMAKRVLDREVARRILTREEIERLRIVLPAVLAIPGVVAGVLTNLTARERQIVVSNAPLADDALRLINDRLAMSLKRREVATAAARPNSSANLARNAVTSSDIQIVASAAVAPKSVDDLVLTVALSTKPTDEARAQIEALAAQLAVCARRRRPRRALPRTRRGRGRAAASRALRWARLSGPFGRRSHPPGRARRADRRLLGGHDLAGVLRRERRPRRGHAPPAQGRRRAVRSVAGGNVHRGGG